MTLFGRRPKTPKSASQSSPGAAHATTSSTPTPDPEESVLPLPLAVVPPEVFNGKTENLDTTRRIEGAFYTIRDAKPEIQKYEDSKLRKVLDWTGTVIILCRRKSRSRRRA
ncbi:hypothetical protein LXA43DRAFT_508561 [Ganoderma leucocontextum]|nr:hypothetical protein LXA43DRAFT_508561 [Ganoderma leucocontextum]